MTDRSQSPAVAANAVPEAGRSILLPGLAATLLALLPPLLAHHLPLLDAPGHESRLAVLRDLIGGKGSAFYDLGSFLLPNIAFDTIGLAFASILGPENAGRLFFAVTAAATLWGVLVLNRTATGRWSLVPLAAALLLFNLIAILGFLSYAFGLALVPWALALRLRLKQAPLIAQMAAGMLAGILLLFCHVASFGTYAVMSAGFAFDAWLKRRIDLARLCLWWLEAVPAAALFLAMPTTAQHRIHYDQPFLKVKLFNLAKSVTSGSMAGDLAFLAGAAAIVLLVALFSRPRLVASFLPGLLGLVALYFALPFQLNSGSYVDGRLPIAIALLLLAGLDVRIRRGAVAWALIGIAIMATAVKQGAVALLWHSFDPEIDGLESALDSLPDGAVVMQAECQPESSDVRGVYRERQPALTHFSAMAGFADTRFAAATWAIAGQQPVSVKSAYRPYYDLESALGSSVCGAENDRSALNRIRALMTDESGAGHAVPPVFLLLIRPRTAESLLPDAKLLAKDEDYELYAVNATAAPG